MERARCLWIAVELGMTADAAAKARCLGDCVTRRLLARAALEHRSDDTAEVIAQRLALYQHVTSPILCWYRDRGILVSVDAMRPVQQVSREILTALDQMRPLLDHAPGRAGHPAELAALGEAFGAAGPAAGPPG
jgi:adenylate kinase